MEHSTQSPLALSESTVPKRPSQLISYSFSSIYKANIQISKPPYPWKRMLAPEDLISPFLVQYVTAIDLNRLCFADRDSAKEPHSNETNKAQTRNAKTT
jgi:hypothetical protein